MGRAKHKEEVHDTAAGLQEFLPVATARVFDLQKAAATTDGGLDALKSNVKATNERNRIFDQKGALAPPYDPQLLGTLYDHSAALRPNVEAYATNIDAFGHRFESLTEPDHNGQPVASADPEVTDGNPVTDPAPEPTALPPVDPKMKLLVDAEKKGLKRFFDYCCIEQSFSELRQMTRQDVESTGNGYWEVLRNTEGRVTQFVYIAGIAMRLMPLGDQVPVELKILDEDGNPATIRRYRRFRRFIQIVGDLNNVVFFKEFGDVRIMSSKTGKYYPTVEAMKAVEDGVASLATEVKHFKIHSPLSAYGVPRWIGALVSVMGSRMAEEVNFAYFDNKSVPPLAILVSGGRLAAGAVKRIQDYIQNEVKGRSNFHKILVIEAEPAAGVTASDQTGKMKIEIKPLTSAQHNDAQFQNYDERNIDKIGSMFRMPRLLRGDARDFNRATAAAALDFAEMQVFQPARQSFDWIINREFLADMGIRFWKFVSLAPVTRDPTAMSEIIRNLVNAGTLTPGEGRELAADVFNRDFAKINALWTKQPLVVTLAGMAGGVPGFANGKPQGGADGLAGGDKTDSGMANNPEAHKRFVDLLFELKKSLEDAEAQQREAFVAQHLKQMNKNIGGELEREVIKVPLATFKKLVGPKKFKELTGDASSAG